LKPGGPPSEGQDSVKVFPELSNKKSAPSGGFQNRAESVQKIVGIDSENLGFLSQSESINS